LNAPPLPDGLSALNELLNISILEVGTRDGVRMGQRQRAGQPEEARCRLPNGGEGVLDPYVIEFDDLDAAGELRFNAIGLVDSRMLCVTYTMRGDVVRIISARGAEPHEKKKYHEI
jgi:Ribonuclease toxin, BrnT, of type II toxin-antitoxin system